MCVCDAFLNVNWMVLSAGMFFIRTLGPIIGLAIGSICNRIYYTLEGICCSNNVTNQCLFQLRLV